MLKTYRIIPFTLFLFVLTLTTASSGFTPSREWSVHDAACGEDGDDAVIFTLRGGKNPTCWKNLAISLQAQLGERPEPVASTPPASTPVASAPCKVDNTPTGWMPRKKYDDHGMRLKGCVVTPERDKAALGGNKISCGARATSIVGVIDNKSIMRCFQSGGY
jgi:hypothetical protein